jgi:hypothetical protein
MNRRGRGRPSFYRLIGRLPVPCADVLEWARWRETADHVVAKTDIGPLHVSTIFLGIDHDHFGAGEAILFETMIFSASDAWLDDWQTRCATWDQAQKMHAEAVAHARQLLAAADADVANWQAEPK